MFAGYQHLLTGEVRAGPVLAVAHSLTIHTKHNAALLITNIPDITDMTRLLLLCIPLLDCYTALAIVDSTIQLLNIITEVSSTDYCTAVLQY